MGDAGNESVLGADMLKLQLGAVRSSPRAGPGSGAAGAVPAGRDPSSPRCAAWNRVSSSESEFSDAEGGIQSKVR